MQIIRDHLHDWNRALTCFVLPVERLTLAKRRWRGEATDGAEFGFDLEHPLSDGDVFFQNQTAVYQLAQQAESVLEISLPSPVEAAQIGWKIGNLHFQISIAGQTILAPDDPAVRQMFDRERVAYRLTRAIFKPLGGGHSHGHPAH